MDRMNQENHMFFKEFFCSKTGEWKNVLVLSLQHTTMIKIAIELWNQIDLRESILNYRLNHNRRSNWQKWKEIEEKVLAKVAQLAVPELLKKEFLCVISPIGVQIKNWWVSNQWDFDISKWPNRFAWTPEGTIDRVKTAQSLLKDLEIDVNQRYAIACTYCLEDELPEMWKQISEERKEDYYHIDENFFKCESLFLVRFWTCQLKGELSKLEEWLNLEVDEGESMSPYFYTFDEAVGNGNKMAAEFFFSKLTEQEKYFSDVVTSAISVATLRSHVLYCSTTVPKEYYGEVFLLLLSRMSEGQREVVFDNCPYELLECLLEWPNRPLFVEMAERTLRSIKNNQHRVKLMSLIIESIANGWSDCTSRQLFHHFWNLNPLRYKKRTIEGIDYCTVMKLYERNDVGIIRALFQHACAVEKEGLILCRRRLDITARELMKWKGWEPMEETVVKFREEFLERETK